MRASTLLAALAIVAGPVSAQSTTMNYAYSVSGDPQARPIQAFDDGQRLYVQFRDVSAPPAPIGATGPLTYTIRGPYLILPMTRSVQLRYGPFSAWVRADGAADAAPGVVSVSRPVEVPSQELSVAAVVVEPERPHLAQTPAAAPVAAQSGGVTGEIVAVGDAGESKSATADAPAPAPAGVGGRTIMFAEATVRTSFSDFAGRHVVIRADGTAGGASAALVARNTCAAARAADCSIEYRGAPAGQLFIAEKK